MEVKGKPKGIPPGIEELAGSAVDWCFHNPDFIYELEVFMAEGQNTTAWKGFFLNCAPASILDR